MSKIMIMSRSSYRYRFGFSSGNRITSRIDSAPVSSIVRRSMPDPKPAGRRHAVFEREEKFFVELLRFFAGLLEQALPLRHRDRSARNNRAKFPGR